ncbi:MAG: hypothetical protein EOP09_20920, partial [Proteobacteria bacterium]
LSQWSPNPLSTALSQRWMTAKMASLGMTEIPIVPVDHHQGHVAGAVFTSGWNECLAITLDGLGDGRSGRVSVWKDNRIEPVSELAAADSFGILFEHVTNILNYRELEDEGKVMALANFATPVGDDENPVLKLIDRRPGEIRFRYQGWALREELAKIFWKYPPEQMAYMTQRTLEVCVPEWITYWLKKTGQKKLVMAGGVASNVKLNGLIRALPEVEHLSI